MISGSKNDSRTKSQGKKPFTLAKDPKQAALAVFVIILFFVVAIRNTIQYQQQNNPQPTVATAPPTTPSTPTDQLAQQPQTTTVTVEPDNSNPMQPPSQDVNQDQALTQDANNIYNQATTLQKGKNVLKNEAKKIGLVKESASDIEIIPKKASQKFRGKMVAITVDSAFTASPFLPAGENTSASSSKFSYLPAPPEALPSDTDATKIINTTISGILYDKYSPSAIINIEGTDYLVKKGDTVNHYKILSIGTTQVVVQLGKNIYQAGVGELLSPTDLKFNTIANLNKKFGGNDVSINVKKRVY